MLVYLIIQAVSFSSHTLAVRTGAAPRITVNRHRHNYEEWIDVTFGIFLLNEHLHVGKQDHPLN